MDMTPLDPIENERRIEERLRDLEIRFTEFERITKARCEVVENFVGLMPSSNDNIKREPK